MAVHTPLKISEIRAFLEEAGLGPEELEAVEGVPEGSIHTTYRLRHDGKVRYLRRYEGSSIASIEHELALLGHLRVRLPEGAPVLPRVLLHGDGARYRPLCGAPAALFEEVPGSPREARALGVDQLTWVGKALGQLHLASEEFGLRRENSFGAETVGGWLQALERAPGTQEVARALPSLWRALEAGQEAVRDPGARARVVGHGDLFEDNLHWRGEGVCGVLDLEMACDLPRAWDLAVGLLVFCWGPDGLDPGRAGALLGAYKAQTAITVDPEELLGAMRFVAVRYTLSRIRDFAHAHLPADRLLQKDWHVFARRVIDLERVAPEHLHNPDPG